MSKGHLMNVAHSLINRMRNYLQDQWMINSNKTIDGIVDYLSDYWHHCCFFVKAIISKDDKSTIAEFNKLNLKAQQNSER